MVQAHQQRVIAEKAELDVKLRALRAFFETGTYGSLPKEERNRQQRQCYAMADYSRILGERIAAFTS
jgi:hypothetical protein